MKWFLILLAVNINNPNDIPGKLSIELQSKEECVRLSNNMQYWLKFDSFKIIAQCQEYSSSPMLGPRK